VSAGQEMDPFVKIAVATLATPTAAPAPEESASEGMPAAPPPDPPAEGPTSTPGTAGGTEADLRRPEPRARRRRPQGMVRASLLVHPKFLRLVEELGMPAPHVLGHLVTLWRAAHERPTEPLGDARTVELLADWGGEPGVLAAALHSVRFIDDVGGATACFRVHDLRDHAPEAVKKRIDRAAVRKELGVTMRERRQASARARWGRVSLARWEEKHVSGRRSQPLARSEMNATEPEDQE
jgi:hypothetical protein